MKIGDNVHYQHANKEKMQVLASAMETLYDSLKSKRFSDQTASDLVVSAFKGVVSE